MSTNSNRIAYTETVTTYFDSTQVDAIYMDINKAFDVVNCKMSGVGGLLLTYFQSYLKNLLFHIAINRAQSE